MKLQAYAVLDTKAGNYAQPFFMQNDKMAIRAFGDLANDMKSTISKHPEDYTLYNIGSYDDNVAGLEGFVKVKAIMVASALVKTKQNTPMFPPELVEAYGKQEAK